MHIEYHVECFIEESLQEDERWFKNLYRKCPGYFGLETETKDLFKNLTPREWHLLDGRKFHMEETDFFHTDMDVQVVPHGRYSPAFLHYHSFIEMIYVFKGSCINHFQDRDVVMNAGDVGIVAPGVRHGIEGYNDDCIVYNYLIRTSTFEETFFAMLSSDSILAAFFRHIFYNEKGDSYLMFRTGEDRQLQVILAKIFEECQGEAHLKNEMIDSLLMLFFVELIRRHESDVVLWDEDEEDRKKLFSIFRYIQKNYKTLSLGEMSQHFHYSERHMKRVIKKYTGLSFSENIQQIRMAQARHLLSKTHMSVEEVSAAVGYSDVSSFRYAFKKFYKVLPKDFKH